MASQFCRGDVDYGDEAHVGQECFADEILDGESCSNAKIKIQNFFHMGWEAEMVLLPCIPA